MGYGSPSWPIDPLTHRDLLTHHDPLTHRDPWPMGHGSRSHDPSIYVTHLTHDPWPIDPWSTLVQRQISIMVLVIWYILWVTVGQWKSKHLSTELLEYHLNNHKNLDYITKFEGSMWRHIYNLEGNFGNLPNFSSYWDIS